MQQYSRPNISRAPSYTALVRLAAIAALLAVVALLRVVINVHASASEYARRRETEKKQPVTFQITESLAPSVGIADGSKLAVIEQWTACERDPTCCKRIFSPAARPHAMRSVMLRGTGLATKKEGTEVENDIAFKMAVYPKSDIVSNQISKTGSWDLTKTQSLLQTLGGKMGQMENGTLLDVGANIGWFSIVAAAAGFDVIAVEPFEENRRLLQHSLCLAQRDVRERVTLLGVGLHDQDGTMCQLWQQPAINRGDTVTICQDGADGRRVLKLKRDGFTKLGEARMRRLDSLIEEGSVRVKDRDGNPLRIVMKIDVEGFEPFAMKGAESFLKGASRPTFVFSEFSPSMIELASQAAGQNETVTVNKARLYLDFMKRLGYNGNVTAGLEIQDILFSHAQMHI